MHQCVTNFTFNMCYFTFIMTKTSTVWMKCVASYLANVFQKTHVRRGCVFWGQCCNWIQPALRACQFGHSHSRLISPGHRSSQQSKGNVSFPARANYLFPYTCVLLRLPICQWSVAYLSYWSPLLSLACSISTSSVLKTIPRHQSPRAQTVSLHLRSSG